VLFLTNAVANTIAYDQNNLSCCLGVPMRYFIYALVCVVLLAACHPSSSQQTAAAPTVSSVVQVTRTPPTHVPVVPTVLVPTLRPTHLAVVSPGSIVPTPFVTAPPFAGSPLAPPAPFRPTRLEHYPLPIDGWQAIAWLPNDNAILYAGAGLYFFDTLTHHTHTIASDLYQLRDYQQAFPVYDSTHNVIVYARQKTKSTADIVAIDPKGTFLRSLVTDVFITNGWEIYGSDARRKANAESRSVFDVSIASNGRVGVLAQDHIISRRINEPDRLLALPASVVQQLSDAGPDDYHQLWLAPDGRHYALAITETLSVYDSATSTPLLSLNFSSGHEPLFHPVLVIGLQWSPDSTAIYYQPAWTEDVGNYELYGPYAQRITEPTPQVLGRGTQLPRVPGGSTVAASAAWSPDSHWLAIGQYEEVQCGGTSVGCLQSQTIVDPFAARASVVWAEEGFIRERVVWSPDGTRIAVPCRHYEPDSPAEMCIMTLEHQVP
jgi:hypothetical protein